MVGPARGLGAVLLAGLASACGGGTEERGSLFAVPNVVDFGRISLPGTGETEVLLINDGGSDITLRSVEWSEDLEGELTVDHLPARVSAELEARVRFILSPDAPGERRGRVRLILEDAVQSELVLEVRAAVAGPGLVVGPERIDFGRVRIGQAATASITVTNRSSAARVVVAASFEPGSASGFEVALGAARRLAPGASMVLPVRYEPQTEGPHEARVVLADGSPAPPPAIVLRGEGLAAPLSFRPATLDFSGVPISRSRSREAELVNRTAAPVRVLAWRLSGDPAFSTDLPEAPFVVDAAAALRFTVELAPLEARQHDASLVLELEGDPTPAVAALTGSGVAFDRGLFELEPEAIDFGPIEQGGSSRRALWIHSTGGVPLELEALGVDPPGLFRAVSPVALPRALVPGDRLRIDLIATAPAEGVTGRAELSITTPGETRRIPLSITGAGGPLQRVWIEPRIDLGVVAVGSSHGRSALVENVGTATLSISDLALEDDAGGRFSLALPLDWGWPIAVAPEDVFRVPVSFSEPGALVSRTATLRVTSDDPLSPRMRTELRIRAVQPGSTDRLRVCLTWPVRGNNVDLHLAPAGVPFLDAPLAVSYCNPSASLGARGDATDDPILRRDAIHSATEECIDLSMAPTGRYAVAADWVTATSTGTIDVRLELRPLTRAAELHTRRMGPGTRWNVGMISWDRDRGEHQLELSAEPLAAPDQTRCF